MIGGGQIANLFLEKNLISEFYLTEINNDYYGDSSINLDYFKLMQKEEIKKTDNYKIYLMKNTKYKNIFE